MERNYRTTSHDHSRNHKTLPSKEKLSSEKSDKILAGDRMSERNRTASLDRRKHSARQNDKYNRQDSDPTAEYFHNGSNEENKRLSQSQGRPASRYGSTEKLLQGHEQKTGKIRKHQTSDRKSSSKQTTANKSDPIGITGSDRSRIPFRKLSGISTVSSSKYKVVDESNLSDSIQHNSHNNTLQMVKSKSDNNTTAHTSRHLHQNGSEVKRSKTYETSISNQFNQADSTSPQFYGINSDQGIQKLGKHGQMINASNEMRNSNDFPRNGSMTGIPNQNPHYLSIDMEIVSPGKSEEDLNVAGYCHHGLRHSFPSSPFSHIIPINVPRKYDLFFSILFLFGSLFLMCPTVAILSILLPLSYLVKKFCSCCFCYGYKCQAGELLTKKELASLRGSQIENNFYQALLTIESGLDLHRIQDLINARIICSEDEEGMKLYPKLSMKIIQTCSGLAWVQDTNFLMKNHVFKMPPCIENLEDLQEYISNLSSRSLSMTHSPWEIQVLQGFGEHHDTILYLRISPCIMDGISLMYILQKSLADTGYVTAPKLKFSSQNIFLNSLKSLFVGPLVFLQKYLCLKRDFNMFHGDHVHFSGKQILTWSEPFDLETANRIKQITRSTMNDVLLSVTAGCIRNYFKQNGIVNPYDINSLIAVQYSTGCSYYRTENSNFIFIKVPLPLNTEGAIPRLWKVKHVMDKISSSALFSVTRGATWVTSCLFSNKTFHNFWNRIYGKFTCVVSNIPGPEGTLTFASKQIKSVIYWAPPIQNVAVGISFLTYGQSIRMAVIAERSVLSNPEVLTKEFIAQMDKLSELLAHRRIPGEYLTKKMESLQQLDNEIQAEPTIPQLQMKMAVIQQEIQDLKVQLDSDGRLKHSSKDHKIIKKIEELKEQYRELLVEIRQRKAAENENAMILTEDNDDLDEDKEEGETRRPFRRRTLSISSRLSRLSTTSVSSTARPLTAATTPSTPQDFPDNISMESFRTDGVSHINRPIHRRQQSEVTDEMQILEYASSPLTERRFRTF